MVRRLAALLAVGCASHARIASSAAPPACQGSDEEWGRCPELPPCGDCTPQDCVFSDWAPWYEGGGCSQIKFRERSVAVQNNACGAPCTGAKIESAHSPNAECVNVPRDCVLSTWTPWTACDAGKTQQFRSREVRVEPLFGGRPCDGALRETRECEGSGPEVSDCKLSEWHEWTACSASCGPGQHSRTRRILADAVGGGATCEDSLQEVGQCSLGSCPDRDCMLGAWEAWSQCDVASSQRFRSRKIETPSLGAGKACTGPLKETIPCPAVVIPDCELSTWSGWSKCDKACGTGQQFRTRNVLPPDGSSACSWHSPSGSESALSLRDTQFCNAQPCGDGPVDCQLAEWSQWSRCSSSCGQGAISRNRSVARPADEGGKGCEGVMEEINDCEGKECAVVDCRWGEWYDWSACSASCGSGSKRRSRVVMQSPRNGGKLCDPNDKSEVAECVLENCGSGCKNAEWEAWTAWSVCSATCGEGYQVRGRRIAKEANHCGRPVDGLTKEYRHCEGEPCIAPLDCTLSDWGEWSVCSCTCEGIRDRSRVVTRFAAGSGKACENLGLRQVEGCNPGPGEDAAPECSAKLTDCLLSAWEDWSTCTRTCGGGQKERSRAIEVFPKTARAKFCRDPLTVTAGCNMQPCVEKKCIDCEYSDWSEWGDCSHCGDQRYRTRHVSRLPNQCGKQCDLASTREASNCTSLCVDKLLCMWSEWTGDSGCNDKCGGMSMRTRTLGFQNAAADTASELFRAPASALCTGSQLDTATCDGLGCSVPCEPRSCIFNMWSDWGGAGDCLGLCTRTRSIAQHGRDCGGEDKSNLCVGSLQETKRCERTCDDPVDCEIGDWGAWSTCKVPHDQKSRSRHVVVFPRNGGKACADSLSETKPCLEVLPVDCKLSNWGDWNTCTLSCGGGIQSRGRVIDTQAANQGNPCEDSLEEMQACNEQACGQSGPPVDCSYDDWTDWTPCTDKQKSRERHIETLASNGGQACSSQLSELVPCDEEPTDCDVSEWTAWDPCDRQCGGGQQARHRQIRAFPQFGGAVCPSSMHEVRGCNTAPCAGSADDCYVGEWDPWLPCSASCGVGQRKRERSVIGLRGPNGVGCSDLLVETEPCPENPSCDVQDCEWEHWSDWSECDSTCGGGMRSRNRNILVMPSAGGKACDANALEELDECNTQPCNAIISQDGEWAPWTEWSPCSATCRSGVSFRTRQVAKTAKGDGTPAYGLFREQKICNEDISCYEKVDCVFTDWDDWGGCTATCNGVMGRHRRIEHMGRGSGEYCIGALKETFPCNPIAGEPAPEGCGPKGDVAKDCDFGVWSEWSTCSVACGGGERRRERQIAQHAEGSGVLCEGPVQEVQECAREACGVEGAVDCELGLWSEWGPCDKCGGQENRFRHVLRYAERGGKLCPDSDMQETRPCPTSCGDDQGVCTWQLWGDWGLCSSSCGEGKRSRVRHLYRSFAPEVEPIAALSSEAYSSRSKEIADEYEDLTIRASVLRSSAAHGGQRRELFVAFAGGAAVVLASALAFRAFRGQPRALPDELQALRSRAQDRELRIEAGAYEQANLELPLVE
eukprot:TRINITY_DN14117_c0_g5_i1.p1 TRINITY_DN14117_c0_g5~~TRINITY_DN14117_c0_g5_i1.p1  ORF type:complete len:1558 (+),score=314.31 TRINITY_DN14117_c0_g5_i1:79-4752(+)